jgi:hypothetical protein
VPGRLCLVRARIRWPGSGRVPRRDIPTASSIMATSMLMIATARIAIRGTAIPAAGPAARTIHIPSSTRGWTTRLDCQPSRKTLVMITIRDGHEA